MLTADAPPEGYTLYVYAFNGLTFAELGPLAENSTPSAGNYVLSTRNDSTETLSLPSAFLAVT